MASQSSHIAMLVVALQVKRSAFKAELAVCLYEYISLDARLHMIQEAANSPIVFILLLQN